MGKKFREKTLGQKIRSIIFRVLLFLLLIVFLGCLAAAVWFQKTYGPAVKNMWDKAVYYVATSDRDTFKAQETSICYYADGTVMQTLKNGKDVYYLPFDSIPKTAINAILAVEDRKFYDHKGFDIYAIIRAGRAFIENKGAITQGGSTITQQLARNIFLTNEKTAERKITEIFTAYNLEKRYSKADILEFYFNNIYFSNGYYGIQAASMGFFNKAVGDLTLAETAFLCGIPNSPSRYDPIKHYDDALERRNRVLRQMNEVGYITAAEYYQALAEKPVLVRTVTQRKSDEETYTYYCAATALMRAQGFEFRYEFASDQDEEAYNEYYDETYSAVRHQLSLRGYRIYTSINPEKQALLHEAADNELQDFTGKNDEGIYEFQTAAVTIDNETGLVVAIIGGRTGDYDGYTLNRAYQSPRQPGSSIKPLIVYTPWFERGLYPDNRVVDEPFEGGPRNAGDSYSGEIDIRYAVSSSKNTVAWKLFKELGIETGLGYLKKMGFSHIVDNDYYPAASIGGLTYGVTAVEMASAYAAIENGGIFRTPTCIRRITDARGELIVDNVSAENRSYRSVSEYRVYQENACRIMTDVMTTVMASGTGRKISLAEQACAGKTGTSTKSKDGWFIGFTRYYTTSVWVGYDMPKEIDDLSGGGPQGRIWQAYMTRIHEGLPKVLFDPYEDPREPEVVVEMPVPIDSDGDGVYDLFPYGWIDKDGDGIPDGYPDAWRDLDGDGIPDGYLFEWVDTDGDGIADSYLYGWEDLDGDGIPETNVYGLPLEEEVTDENAWTTEGSDAWVGSDEGWTDEASDVWVRGNDAWENTGEEPEEDGSADENKDASEDNGETIGGDADE